MIRSGIIATEDYIGPHGMRCIDCDREIQPGDEVAERLLGMADSPLGPASMVELICGKCAATESQSTDGEA